MSAKVVGATSETRGLYLSDSTIAGDDALEHQSV